MSERDFKRDFPLLDAHRELAFLDSAATAQRPRQVIEAQAQFYETLNSNPLRGLYRLSMEATQAIEDAREKVARFIGVPESSEVVFTRNTSESLNLFAKSWCGHNLHEGDKVVITILEHHSNLIPWQMVCKHKHATLEFMRPNEEGILSDEEIQAKITPGTKIVSVAHVSNVLGVELPIKKIVERAHEVGALCVVDGAQSAPHIPVDVKDLGCDAFAFSGHKLFGPMGIGVLWARREILEAMPPMLTGGEMIDWVSETDAAWAPIPMKFEAGTQDAAGIAGLGAAIDYINEIGFDRLHEREQMLVQYLHKRLSELNYIRMFGPKDPTLRHGVVAFNVCGVHPHDVASILDTQNVAIRAGHHCAQPLLTWLNIESCCRASVSVYNDTHDIDQLIDGLGVVWGMFNGS